MAGRVYNVLFLCTGNSARSIMAEAILNHWGKDRFRAYSAGSQPKARPHQMAVALLNEMRLPTGDLRSKSWDEFATPDAPKLDFLFTVCDNAAQEVCPVWPGQPMSAHWGIPDPAAAQGSEAEKRLAFRQAFAALERRIRILVSLRVEALDRIALKAKVDDIGRLAPETRAS
jgi:arsenate reductase